MVRREEQQWRNRAVLFLDTRASAHSGRGPSSSFEYAVSAAASIGVRLAREGIASEFITDAGPADATAPFEDVLLDSLAVIRPSRATTLIPALARGWRGSSGLLIAVLGRISPEEARQLASARHSSGAALALLLAVSTWSGQGPGAGAPGETDAAASVLAAAGWRVATITAGMPLGTAWEVLNHPAGQPVRFGVHAPAETTS
jgi:uncharacterized protein (DUF58 family)